jgi:hypothetical protein
MQQWGAVERVDLRWVSFVIQKAHLHAKMQIHMYFGMLFTPQKEQVS